MHCDINYVLYSTESKLFSIVFFSCKFIIIYNKFITHNFDHFYQYENFSIACRIVLYIIS